MGDTDRALGDRMKGYESSFGAAVDPSKPFIMRLDGHCFHKFTSQMKFRKPFDERLHRAMVRTVKMLMDKQFQQVTLGYTQSDEITLVFPAILTAGKETLSSSSSIAASPFAIAAADNDVESASSTSTSTSRPEPANPFNGRVQKLVSLGAAQCSLFFNKNIAEEDFSDAPAEIQQALKFAGVIFDARVFNLPSEMEVFNNLVWRCRYDCVRNSKTLLGTVYYPQSKLNRVPANEVVEMLFREKHVDWYAMPRSYRYGTFVKREIYFKDGYNPKSKETVRVERRRFVGKSFDLDTSRIPPSSAVEKTKTTMTTTADTATATATATAAPTLSSSQPSALTQVGGEEGNNIKLGFFLRMIAAWEWPSDFSRFIPDNEVESVVVE